MNKKKTTIRGKHFDILIEDDIIGKNQQLNAEALTDFVNLLYDNYKMNITYMVVPPRSKSWFQSIYEDNWKPYNPTEKSILYKNGMAIIDINEREKQLTLLLCAMIRKYGKSNTLELKFDDIAKAMPQDDFHIDEEDDLDKKTISISVITR